MNILLVSEAIHADITGVYDFIDRVGSLLQKRGHRVAVLVAGEGIGMTKKKIDTIDVYEMSSLSVLFCHNARVALPFNLRSRLRRFLHWFSPDIVHILDHCLLSRLIVVEAGRYGMPLVASGYIRKESVTGLFGLGRWQRYLERKEWRSFSKVYNEASLVIVGSESDAGVMRSKLEAEVCVVSVDVDDPARAADIFESIYEVESTNWTLIEK